MFGDIDIKVAENIYFGWTGTLNCKEKRLPKYKIKYLSTFSTTYMNFCQYIVIAYIVVVFNTKDKLGNKDKTD